MKTILISAILFIIVQSPLEAQHSWQQISNSGMKKIAENFKNPPPEYGMILWWGWDGQMSDTVIRRDLDRIKVQGFRGVMIEAGNGTLTNLSGQAYRAIPQIKYLHRTWKDADLYFIFNESEKLQSFNITLQGRGKSRIWNAATGQISPLISTALFFEPWGTKFIAVRK
jgi:hypothetical protein